MSILSALPPPLSMATAMVVALVVVTLTTLLLCGRCSKRPPVVVGIPAPDRLQTPHPRQKALLAAADEDTIRNFIGTATMNKLKAAGVKEKGEDLKKEVLAEGRKELELGRQLQTKTFDESTQVFRDKEDHPALRFASLLVMGAVNCCNGCRLWMLCCLVIALAALYVAWDIHTTRRPGPLWWPKPTCRGSDAYCIFDKADIAPTDGCLQTHGPEHDALLRILADAVGSLSDVSTSPEVCRQQLNIGTCIYRQGMKRYLQCLAPRAGL